MTIKEKPKLSPDEVALIKDTQDYLVEEFTEAKSVLCEEEVAMVLKRSFTKEEIKLITHFL